MQEFKKMDINEDNRVTFDEWKQVMKLEVKYNKIIMITLNIGS